jgi:hypothetical protein
MRCKRQERAEFVEQLVLPVVNIVFLLVPVLLVALELTSFAALQASTPDVPQAAQAPADLSFDLGFSPIQPAAPSQASVPDSAEPPPSTPLFPDPMLGYGP